MSGSAPTPTPVIYPVDVLLKRLYTELGDKQNTTKSRLDMPEVSYINRKTVFSNFRRLCEQIKRSELDVKGFFTEELGCISTIDQNGVLILTGKFNQTQLQTVLGNYIKQFVQCQNCKKYDTNLIKENRIKFIDCNVCKSRRGL